MAEKDGISPNLILGIAVLGLALLAGWYFGSPYLFQDGPPPPVRLGGGSASETAPPPPDAPVLSDRVRIFFIKGGVEKCMQEHLAKELHVDGQLAVTLKPDGTAENAEARTEPSNPGVASCVTHRFAKGFPFSGEVQRVTYTFNARWENEKLQLTQNVSSGPVER